MRIVEITVKGLFGVFDHNIRLNLKDRMTIIHGPNGFGKTTLLQMLDGLFSRRYIELRHTPFERFQVVFDDDSALWVEKTRTEDDSLGIKISFRTSGAEEVEPFVPSSLSVLSEKRRFPSHILEDLVDGLARVGRTEWVYVPSGQVLSLEEVVDRFGHLLPPDLLGEEREPVWWREVQDSIDIQFIKSQRLFSFRAAGSLRRSPKMIAAVTEYSEELVEIIREKLAESADLSQALDRTFPARLVKQIGHSEITGDELREKLGELEKRRLRLKEAGLLDKSEDMDFLPAGEITDYARDVLAVYVQDVEQKLSVFDEIATKIDLFQRIINDRFLYKQMTVSKERGFIFISQEGKQLPLTKLSSGEQHELVLLYQLLFKVNPDSLVLIDEPELSLHVAWQRMFLRDLQEITKLALFDVLIATHSPQIIADRWDLTVQLEGPQMP